MSLIDIAAMSFVHDDGRTLFQNVSLKLDADWRIGLIGRNGRGKTTFLKLLQGELQPVGTIRSSVVFEYFPFAVENPYGTALELADRVLPEVEPWRLKREASLLDLPEEALRRPVATLSGGETTKLLLALLFLREDRFRLIDEPTNHLDQRGREVLGRYLGRKRGFILVSHDRSLLDSCVDHILSINKTSLDLQQGNFSSWNDNRLRLERHERSEHRRLSKEEARLAESARQSANWSGRAERGKYGNGPVDRGFIGHKAAKLMQRAKAVENRRNKALEETSRLLRNVEIDLPLSMRTLDFHGAPILEAAGLSLEHDGKTIVRGLSFRLGQGDRLVVRGRNGSGKSSLLRALAGLPGRFRGRLRIPPSLRISYVPQDASSVRGTLRDFARERGIDEGACRTVLDRFGFERSQFALDMATFSAGQKKKALLAASLCQEAHLYLWDEPLNYLDMASRMQIEDCILECGPSLILVEHDRVFTEHVGTQFLDLDQTTGDTPNEWT